MDNPVLTQWLTSPEGLASRMRALRIGANLTGRQLAEALDWTAYKVSRLENGRTVATAAELEAWAGACGVPEATAELLAGLEHSTTIRLAWRHRLAGGQAVLQAGYNALTSQATTIVIFETRCVPGVLQTADYAAAILRDVMANHEAAVTDIDEAVATRMERGRMINDPARTFELIVTEPVLSTSPAPPSVMIDQLDRLLAAMELPNVTLRILPNRADVQFIPVNAFDLYDDTLVIVESFAGEEHHHDDEDTATYRRVLQRLRAASVTGDDARALIRSAIERHRADAVTPPG